MDTGYLMLGEETRYVMQVTSCRMEVAELYLLASLQAGKLGGWQAYKPVNYWMLDIEY